MERWTCVPLSAPGSMGLEHSVPFWLAAADAGASGPQEDGAPRARARGTRTLVLEDGAAETAECGQLSQDMALVTAPQPTARADTARAVAGTSTLV